LECTKFASPLTPHQEAVKIEAPSHLGFTFPHPAADLNMGKNNPPRNEKGEYLAIFSPVCKVEG
jgi:hypothetical protein